LATPQYRPPEIIPERLFAVRKAGAIVEKNIYKVLLVVEPLLCNVRPALMQRFAILSDAINLVLGTWPPEYGLGTPRVTQVPIYARSRIPTSQRNPSTHLREWRLTLA
jgi:hypothetical protein